MLCFKETFPLMVRAMLQLSSLSICKHLLNQEPFLDPDNKGTVLACGLHLEQL